jgi:hypothetical protein
MNQARRIEARGGVVAGSRDGEHPSWGTLSPEVPLYGTPPERPLYGQPGHGLGPEVPLTEPELEPEPEPTVRTPRRQLERGSGGLALVLGLIGLFAFPPVAPAAWILGRQEVRGVDAGRRHPRGRALGQAGLVLGVVGTVLLGFWMLMGGFVLLLLAAAARSLFGG